MKKLIFSAALLTGIVVTAQDTNGKVGINTEKPQATLEITPNATNANGTTNEGILIPRLDRARVKAMGTNPEESTLVYINTLGGTQDATVADVDAAGFYYFVKGTTNKWVKLGAGAAQAKPFTARLGQSTGADYDWTAGGAGYVDFYEFTTDGGAIILPNPTLAENKGRIIHFKNSTGGTINYTGTIGVSYPDRTSSITASSAQIVWSDGNKWYLIGGRN